MMADEFRCFRITPGRERAKKKEEIVVWSSPREGIGGSDVELRAIAQNMQGMSMIGGDQAISVRERSLAERQRCQISTSDNEACQER